MRMSESIKELATALAKAQAEIENPIFDAMNPHYKSKYASLSAVAEAVLPKLNKHGLSLTQLPIYQPQDRAVAGCISLLLHSSGEFIESECLMPLEKHNAHGAGSCITYARRYSMMAIAGVVGDEDDDANASIMKVTPNAGAGDGLSKEAKAKVEGIASSIIDCFEANVPEKAFEVYSESGLDSEQKMFLWTFLDAPMRASIKKQGEAKRKAA